MKIASGVLGFLMMVAGLLGGFAAANMKTTVIGEDGRDVHNIGLIGKQEADATSCVGLAIVGAVLFGSAGVIEAIQVHARRAAEQVEKEAKYQAAMLRLLDAIDANTRHVQPFRPASSKADADFDAAVVAELAPPRPGVRAVPPPQRPKGSPPVR